jgi:predicted nucleic acid-binding protein
VALIVLDAGVIIGVLDANDSHHEVARSALSAARASGARFVLPVSAYAEVMVAPSGRNAAAVATVDAFVDALPASVEPADREIARRAAALRSRHGSRLRLPDALVVATALALEADRVMTTDSRWPRLGVRVEVIGERTKQ